MLDSARSWVVEHKWCLVACSIASALAYGVGRFGTPTRVEERERVVTAYLYTAHTQFENRESQRGKAATRRVEKPDGTVVELTRWRWDNTSDTKLQKDEVGSLVTTVEKEKIVEHDAPRLTMGATVAWDGAPAYGGFLTYRVAGPLVLLGQGEGGAAGWSARAGVGISF